MKKPCLCFLLELPIYCLLEDNSLVSGVQIESERLLTDKKILGITFVSISKLTYAFAKRRFTTNVRAD